MDTLLKEKKGGHWAIKRNTHFCDENYDVKSPHI